MILHITHRQYITRYFYMVGIFEKVVILIQASVVNSHLTFSLIVYSKYSTSWYCTMIIYRTVTKFPRTGVRRLQLIVYANNLKQILHMYFQFGMLYKRNLACSLQHLYVVAKKYSTDDSHITAPDENWELCCILEEKLTKISQCTTQRCDTRTSLLNDVVHHKIFGELVQHLNNIEVLTKTRAVSLH